MPSKRQSKKIINFKDNRSEGENTDDENILNPDASRIRKLEQQNEDFKKQMGSMAADLKALLDFQKAAVQGLQVNANSSRSVVIPPRSSSPPLQRSTPSDMSAEQLMFQTAKLNSNLSNLEKNMKKWDQPTQSGWIKFKDLWIEYINNGGQKSLYDLCSKDVIITLKTRLGIKDLKV